MEKLKPNICVLKTDGINCDEELVHAYNIESVGGNAQIVHINELKKREKTLAQYQILAIPGGFSYGDDITAGKILAIELNAYLADEMNEFVQKQKGLVLGICNGFQVLTRTGLLPFGKIDEMKATLANNDSGHFDCRWINLKADNDSKCVFLDGGKEMQLVYTVAHGEGKFYAKPDDLQRIENEKLVVFRYADANGDPTQDYPANPNGSLNAIAGVCDPSGHILGLMPHPERFTRREHHPNWRRLPDDIKPHGLPIFEKMVSYVKQM
ncbi:MAG: phosphoribosylformylglycinamidine synthase I [Candidatus Levybacteria bacterium]|nr:phosphoribosylformylglycinamidine synthase I [Candidatus Levybacteria bacterium]